MDGPELLLTALLTMAYPCRSLCNLGRVSKLPLAAAEDSAVVARGKYLAEQAIACQECHTPKLESGEYDKTKWMKGATLPYAPIGTIKDWHKSAPDLTPTGTLWKKWGPEGILKFLETAKNPRGNPAGPPMPAYKMSHEDATAIVEYLKTLP